MRMWGESVGQKEREGREAREAIKLTETLATPSSVTQATPSPNLRLYAIPYSGSPSSLTATPELLIFFTPPKIVSCVLGVPTTFRCIGEAILQPCHRLSLSKRPRQDTHHAASLSRPFSHSPTRTRPTPSNFLSNLVNLPKFIFKVQFLREKIYNFVFDLIIYLE